MSGDKGVLPSKKTAKKGPLSWLFHVSSSSSNKIPPPMAVQIKRDICGNKFTGPDGKHQPKIVNFSNLEWGEDGKAEYVMLPADADALPFRFTIERDLARQKYDNKQMVFPYLEKSTSIVGKIGRLADDVGEFRPVFVSPIFPYEIGDFTLPAHFEYAPHYNPERDPALDGELVARTLVIDDNVYITLDHDPTDKIFSFVHRDTGGISKAFINKITIPHREYLLEGIERAQMQGKGSDVSDELPPEPKETEGLTSAPASSSASRNRML